MKIRDMLPEDKRFWAAVGIGSGLAAFFQGISYAPTDPVRGYVSIAAGIVLLFLGFRTAPWGTPKSSNQTSEEIKETMSSVDQGGQAPNPLDAQYEAELRKDRKSLQDALLDQSKSFDKYVLTMAAGALGLSLVFIEQIAPEPKPGTVGVLIGAWASFGSSILITLLSFLASQEACQKQIDIDDKLIEGSIDRTKLPPNIYTTITRLLNWLSMVVFLAGVALLTAFAINNL